MITYNHKNTDQTEHLLFCKPRAVKKKRSRVVRRYYLRWSENSVLPKNESALYISTCGIKVDLWSLNHHYKHVKGVCTIYLILKLKLLATVWLIQHLKYWFKFNFDNYFSFISIFKLLFHYFSICIFVLIACNILKVLQIKLYCCDNEKERESDVQREKKNWIGEGMYIQNTTSLVLFLK